MHIITQSRVLVEADHPVYNSKVIGAEDFGGESPPTVLTEHNLSRQGAIVSPIIDQHSLDLISHSPEQTRRLGSYLGALAVTGDVFCLIGDLGVGKTCFIQGIGAGMGIGEPINSPSFTLVREYMVPASRLRLFHIDLYRLADAVQDARAIGLEDYLYGNGVCAIEWSDRAWELMPAGRLSIEMRYIDAYKRGLLLRAEGTRHQELLLAFRKKAFGN